MCEFVQKGYGLELRIKFRQQIIRRMKCFLSLYVFSCASAKAERSLCSLQIIDQPHPLPWKQHIHSEILDFKSRFGFTTNIQPRLIFIFKQIPSNNSDTNLFLILQNYLKPFQTWRPPSSPNHSANQNAELKSHHNCSANQNVGIQVMT